MDLFFTNGVLASRALDDHPNDQRISFNDRALQYGDGVFETMRIFKGEIPMWEYHLQRLIKAQEVMGLPIVDFINQWKRFTEINLSHIDNACAKLVISRGEGPRGYQIPKPTHINWWLKVTDIPAIDAEPFTQSTANISDPFRLTLCKYVLSRQPALAGLKHLNRLDQVMARSEWVGADTFNEGIMFNVDGYVVEGTMSNIFWLKNDQICTPDLSQEGIDGCVRRWLISQKPLGNSIVIVKDAKLDQLLSSEGVFLTNSIMGIKKVAEIDGQAINQSTLIDEISDRFNHQYMCNAL